MYDRNAERPDIFNLEVDETGKYTLLEMARWTKFLAIMGFIFMGLLILFGAFLGMAMSNLPALGGSPALAGISGSVFLVLYVGLALLYFYPVYALLKYATNMKKALLTSNKTQFNKALAYLKNMFKYMGIITIILLAIYGLGIVFAGAGFIAAMR